MGSLIIQLLPLVIGSLMMPTWVLLVLFLLRSEHGKVAASAFVGGVSIVRLLQGIIFGTVISVSEVTHRRSEIATIVSTLLVVIGILMWVTALRQAFQQHDDELGFPLPKLMGIINALSPPRALGLGMLLVVTSSRAWIFTLAAIGYISQARLGMAQSIVAYLLFVLGTEMLLIIPILLSMRSAVQLDAAAQWLEDHGRPIVVIVSFVVGAFFLWSGLTGLMS